MEEIIRYEQEAKHIAMCICTNWKNYDFTETTLNPEKRVPKLDFKLVDDVVVNEKTAKYSKKLYFEYYTREYDVKFKGNNYSFKVLVEVVFGHVKQYKLFVYMKKDNSIKELLSERL